jgi:hypothetical protein
MNFDPCDAYIIDAEVRRDRGVGSIDRKSIDEVIDDMYRPTTLIMIFPPDERERLIRLLNGAVE